MDSILELPPKFDEPNAPSEKLTLEIKRLSGLLNDERNANLESLRRHDKESADLSAQIIGLQNQLGEEKQ